MGSCYFRLMNQRVKTLVEDIRKLTPEERQELMAELSVTMGDDDEPADGTPEEIEAAWTEEVERRIAADARGETIWTPAADVMARLRRS